MNAPQWLVWLVQTGHIADFAIACLVLEAMWLLRKMQPSQRKAFVLFNTASGILLMLALRTALTNGQPLLLAAFLSASFIAHLGELKNRPQ